MRQNKPKKGPKRPKKPRKGNEVQTELSALRGTLDALAKRVDGLEGGLSPTPAPEPKSTQLRHPSAGESAPPTQKEEADQPGIVVRTHPGGPLLRAYGPAAVILGALIGVALCLTVILR
jgi:hypothetical protein